MEIKVTVTLDPRACEVLTKLADALSKEIKITATAAGIDSLVENAGAQNPPKKRPVLEPADEDTARAFDEAVAAKNGAVSENEPQGEEEPKPADTKPVKQKENPEEPAITDEELRLVAAETKEYFKSTEYVKKALQRAGAKKISEVPAHKRQDFIDYLKKVMADDRPF